MQTKSPYGTPLGEEDLKNTFPVRFKPKAIYNWDAGEAISRYLEELKQGRLIARLCKKCNRKLIPPRMFCELCFRETDEWVYVPDTGTVNTFSLCYISWDMKKSTTPEIPAVIDIDGSSGGFLHLISDIDLKRVEHLPFCFGGYFKNNDGSLKVKTGLRVKAVWKAPSERQGSILDIKYFAPVK